ncbi:ABC-three component system middle component 2 [Clostridium saccharobutylicum]|uniref:Uncharacterized protein n=1 Tax=Clostridium saccharobutylicum TaxID=169679 RepID=A0A1S8NDG2_CLOSA|nr:ABC-three component system middle component 2 [Clostridium saccharobutylicum]OOM14499.1 hypothetical protein CLOSAC_13790 [Clostridium saccharobutylicum]
MNDKLYNTKTEIGLRCLFILKVIYPNFCNLDRLLYLEYLSLYIEGFNDNSTNLHPKYPFQSIEVLEKRQVLKKAILELALKSLIDVENNNELCYVGNSNTLWFVDSIKNKYSKHLLKNIKLVVNETKGKTDDELKNIIFSNTIDQKDEFNDFYPYSEEV